MPRGGKRPNAGRKKRTTAPAIPDRAVTPSIVSIPEIVQVGTDELAEIPKGKRGPYAPTLAKEAAREITRALITAELRPLLEAQIANAKGVKYLVTRHKTSGKFIRVTEAMARLKQGQDEEIIEVWEKDPSVQAFTDLLNRALDKPKEQEQEITVTGAFGLLERIQRARKRLQ